uniref:Putative cytochrome c class I protein n=1 Tax=Geobacter sp. (strain M21) TaxID=443144 RepID=C6E1C1_GEOSM
MQRHDMKVAAKTVLVVCLLVLIISAAVIFSGMVDVAATNPHYALTAWVLQTALEQSVERRAREIGLPAGYGHTRQTAHHYGEMCGLCHGAPGKDPSEIGQGLRPKPPDLAEVADHMPERMVFWVAKNGIRMTGMPAFGKTHRDSELWEMVSFVKSLPGMSPGEYRSAGGK